MSLTNQNLDQLLLMMENKQQKRYQPKQKNDHHQSLNMIYLQNFFNHNELVDFLDFFKRQNKEDDIINMSFKEIDKYLILYKSQNIKKIQSKTPEILVQSHVNTEQSQPFDFFEEMFTKSVDMTNKTNKNLEKKSKDDPFDMYFSPQKKPIKQNSYIEKSKGLLYEDLLFAPPKVQNPDRRIKMGDNGIISKKQLLDDLFCVSTTKKIIPTKQNNEKQQFKVVHSRIARSSSSSQVRSINSNINKPNLPKAYSIHHKINNNSNIQIIPCQKMKAEQLFNHQKVKMYKHEIVAKSFFSIGYVLYHIQVLPQNKLIKRNYDDFQRLRNILEKQFPVIRIPYLQPSNWLYETSLQSIKKQKIMLEYFLNDLLSRKEFRNSNILNQFLSKREHKDFKKLLIQHEKTNGIRCIEQTKNEAGCVELDLKGLQQQNFQIVTAFYKHMHSFIDDLHSQIDNFNTHLTSLTKSMVNIADIFSKISTKIDKYNQELQIKNYRLTNAPITLQFLHDSFKNIEQKFTIAKDSLQGQLLTFLKYEKSNIQTFDPLINTISLFSKAYGRRIAHDDAARIQNIQQNSLKLYLSDKKAIFKNYLTEESKDNLVFQYQNGFIKQQLLYQIQYYFQHFLSDFKKKYQDLQILEKLDSKENSTKEIKLLFQ